jgi:hypothetical protein
VGEAIQAYQTASKLDPKDAYPHAMLGQALLSQGRFAQAKAAVRRCLELIPPDHPYRMHSTRVLRECDRLLALEAKLPAILQGKAKPAEARERLALAVLCVQYKQLYATSARFFAEAFADQPALAEGARAGIRYPAARAAALAAAGQGKDAAGLSEAERARWRREALTWLHVELALLRKVLRGGPPARALVLRVLGHWQRDADLAGLRERAALDQLPADERKACQALWADVEALRKEAAQKE